MKDKLREKLIDLINDHAPDLVIRCPDSCRDCNTGCAGKIADHLIANGVVIIDPQKYPPVAKQMHKRLTQKYEVSCDRCEKTEFCDELSQPNMDYNMVKFGTDVRVVAEGDVCDDCYKDFLEIAENFFDKVNRENEGKPKKKPDAIYLGFSQHDCEAWYKCPLCGRSFGSWSINMKDVRCPDCKEELGGIR